MQWEPKDPKKENSSRCVSVIYQSEWNAETFLLYTCLSEQVAGRRKIPEQHLVPEAWKVTRVDLKFFDILQLLVHRRVWKNAVCSKLCIRWLRFPLLSINFPNLTAVSQFFVKDTYKSWFFRNVNQVTFSEKH